MAKKRLKLCSVEGDVEIPTQCPKQTREFSLPHQPDAETHEMDDDVDQVDSNEVEICITGGSSARGKRGVTRMSDIWNLPSNQRIMLKYNNYFQPIDKEGSILHRFMGTVVRKPNLAPIDYLSWRKMDVKYKNSCWEVLESKFEFPRDPTTREKIRHNTIKKLGDLWRNYKCELKAKYYDESRKRKEILARAPPSVNHAQFARLVDYWRSDEAKERSRKNKENRDKKKDFHTGGSKSIAQYAFEMEKHGEVPSRGKLYIALHQQKNGEPVTKRAKKNIKKLKKLMQKESDVTQGSSGGSSMWAADDAYSKVIGQDRHGRVRGVGFGPTPSMLSDVSSNNSHQLKIISMEEILRDKDREIYDLKERLASIEAKVDMLFSKQSDAQSSKVQDVDGRADCDTQRESGI
ncbi:uncharacterized protein LOC109709952 isoform X2 [Ananas comosus]|uniref:Uncharacterized protein LOC109709952 isoform X2 n=1 Tax=Ananas comosus TaxID=4615 RepID=A0A6P5EWJ4_ANACO|nr:uncharacterized protein LOC109709952 isoform X2 [Ananas comosus]